MIDYQLPKDFSGTVRLEIKDAKGEVIGRYAGTDQLPPLDPKELEIPAYWPRPPQPLVCYARFASVSLGHAAPADRQASSPNT